MPLHIACYNGHLSVVEYLCGLEDIDINKATTVCGPSLVSVDAHLLLCDGSKRGFLSSEPVTSHDNVCVHCVSAGWEDASVHRLL